MNVNNIALQNRIYVNDAGERAAEAVVSKETDVAKLASGQTITGKISSVDGNNATILVDGNEINAKLEGNMSLKEGQMVTFSVKGASDAQLTLAPLYTNLNSEEMASKALSAANIPISEDSLEIVGKMMEAGVSIDKDTLGAMVHASMEFPEADIKNLSEMQRYGLDINENNIEKFSAFKNYENQITGGMEKIVDGITDGYKELLAAGKSLEANELMSSVLKTFSGVTDSDGGIASVTVANEANAQTLEVGTPNQTMLAADVQGLGDGGESLIREKMVISEEALLLKGEDITPSVEVLKQEAEVVNEESIINLETRVIEPGREQQIVNTETAQKVADAWTTLDNTDKSAMVDVLKQSGLGENEAKFLLSENATTNDFFEATRSILSSGNVSEAMMNMLESDDFSSMLKQQIQSQWLLSPIDVENKQTVEKLYDRLNEQVKDLTSAIESISMQGSELAKNLDNMNQNLDFMEQMNQMMQYIQLPLKMNGSEATGDLFVYTNKKSLAENNGSVSALLHLDMKNLGPLDVYASINTGSNKVTTRFQLADDSLIDFMQSHMHILNERLEKRGYAITSEVGSLEGADKRPDVPGMPVSSSEGTLIKKTGFEAFA